MWIEPNGEVKIIRNIDLDSLYDNTIYFETRQAQYNYFSFKAKYTYPKITYQRTNKNHMRVEINAENLYDCNYIMFQNTSFGDRWFYAFIKKVKYVANMVTDIEYEIDEMQTWFWDCTMGLSFVEREHSVRDIIGENRVDENLETGEYVINEMTQSELLKDTESGSGGLRAHSFLVLAMTIHADTQPPYDETTEWKNNNKFYYESGLPTGLTYIGFPFNAEGIYEAQETVRLITKADKYEAILDCFLVPAKVYQHSHNRLVPYTLDYTTNKHRSLDGYVVKNNKLLQAPYNVMCISDMRGNVGTYNYEDFADEYNEETGEYEIKFRYSLGLSCDSSFMITPLNYKKQNINVNEKMVMKGFPHASWNTDMWKAYIAQNGGILPALWKDYGRGVSNVAGGLTSIGMSGYTGSTSELMSGVTRAKSGAREIGEAMISWGEKMRQPPQSSGNYNGDIIYADGNIDFWYMKQTIRYEMAQRIDEYFNMFGYATKRVKYPNINSRPYWNYIKTINANIFGNIPADSLAKIKEIFDKGITFWKNGDDIGRYNLDNRPI